MAALQRVPAVSTMSSMMMQVRPSDLADDVHHFRDVGLGTAFVDDRQVAFEALGQRPGRTTPPTSGKRSIKGFS